jgi:flagellar motor switch protein FliN/FliY
MARKPQPIEREVHEYLASQSRGADVDHRFNQAEQALASVDDAAGEPAAVKKFRLRNLGAARGSTGKGEAELNLAADLDLKIELGRTEMTLEDAARLGQGSMVRLDKLSGDPVDVMVEGRLIARGEVLVLNDKFCVRVTELLDCRQIA